MDAHSSRRLHARYACRIPVRVTLLKRRSKELEGEILDIGLGGAYLRVQASLEKEPIKLNILVKKTPIAIEAQVVRSVGADPKDPLFFFYGICFNSGNAPSEEIKGLVNVVRAEQEYGPKRLSPDYWKL